MFGRACVAVAWAGFAALAGGEQPCANPQYRHGISYVLPLKYGPGFEHFDYANPGAPKGGHLRLPDMGTFDSFNNILEKGRVAAGMDFGGSRNLVFERLLEPAADEPASAYGRLAEGVDVDGRYRWIAFKLRANARWHDGAPVTVHDVKFTFEAFKEHGSVALKTALTDLASVASSASGRSASSLGKARRPIRFCLSPTAACRFTRSTTGPAGTSPRPPSKRRWAPARTV